jgi:hypothetical protein
VDAVLARSKSFDQQHPANLTVAITGGDRDVPDHLTVDIDDVRDPRAREGETRLLRSSRIEHQYTRQRQKPTRHTKN